ncbi:MAG: IS256 family transposase [Bacteroidetes bacterium]|nr:IS256 family transposase [Bacteroidota bacterium]
MIGINTIEEAKDFLKNNKIGSIQDIETSLAKSFSKLIQAALEAEMDNHIGYTKYDWKNKQIPNSRNGHTKKTVQSNYGKTTLEIPRDTDRDFEPVMVKKHERQISVSIEDSILSLYAKGMSTRDIDAHIGKIYDINISAEMVSKITNKILPIAQEWQTRLLEEIYSIIFLDGIIFNVREEGIVKKKTVYIVYGIDINGMKDILGIYIGEAESSKFWLSVLTDLKHRGVKDCLIACVDGLKGFREAIETAFPETEIQKCIVHQIRTSTKFVSYKDRKEFCNDMKPIYKAPNEKAGLEALDKFEKKWGKKYQYACDSWRNNWAELSTFFKYSPEIRRMIYTTNRIEGFNRILRKSTKTKSSFPSDNSLFKLLYLIVEDNTRKWTMPIKNWGLIVNELSIMFGERVTKYL